MTAFYLASRYDQRLEMLAHAEVLEYAGHKVTSRWVRGLHEGATDHETLARCAAEDCEDIVAAQIFVHFAAPDRSGWQSGGRHVELGYALAQGLYVIHVGEPENIFHHLPSIWTVPDWPAFLGLLTSPEEAFAAWVVAA